MVAKRSPNVDITCIFVIFPNSIWIIFSSCVHNSIVPVFVMALQLTRALHHPNGNLGCQDAEDGSEVIVSQPELRAGTLVVCPLAVLKQWASEIDEKVHPVTQLSVHTYYSKVLANG